MRIRLDLTGNIYGELTVVQMLYRYQFNENSKPRTYCKCQSADGQEVIVRADALQSGATKSMKGAGRSGKMIDLSGMKFGLLTAIEPTTERASNGSVVWKCKCDCNKKDYTYVSAGQLIRGHTLSCGCRHQSKWEMLITNLLVELKIKFDSQKRFVDCTNKKQTDMLPFDFYLPDYNMCIEYDGEHHFTPINGWGGYEKFLITKENDSIKSMYCIKNNIKLLRLPYTYSEDDIKNEILKILSPVTITA